MKLFNGFKKTINNASKIIIVPKKEKPPEPKGFLQESPEEYAVRLNNRRGRGY